MNKEDVETPSRGNMRVRLFSVGLLTSTVFYLFLFPFSKKIKVLRRSKKANIEAHKQSNDIRTVQ